LDAFFGRAEGPERCRYRSCGDCGLQACAQREDKGPARVDRHDLTRKCIENLEVARRIRGTKDEVTLVDPASGTSLNVRTPNECAAAVDEPELDDGATATELGVQPEGTGRYQVAIR